ncbi:MAG: TlpA family protein disulfide reductase [Cyclobacteriaceae bacterium]
MNRQQINLVLTANDVDVNIEASGQGATAKSNVTGSTGTDFVESIDSIARKKQSDTQLLNQEAMQARQQGNNNLMNEIAEQYYKLMAKHDKGLKQKIWESRESIAGLYGMNYLDLEAEFTFADSVASHFNKAYPDHLLTQDLVSRVDNMRVLAVGADAPEILLPTPDGEELALSSLRGKYVLIDFWAAWCKPCRMENPNVLALYKQYGGEEFEILGVSLDRKKEDWVKAIADDGLPWKHVSDLKYFNSEAARIYQINAIPATYLIGPDGKIVAKNLRGATLRAKLQELFG